MLVLTRKAGQNIRIGEDIVVSIVRTRGGRVRLGIEAPRHVSVRREEISARGSNGSTTKRALGPRATFALG
jgi:carbon storage regulator